MRSGIETERKFLLRDPASVPGLLQGPQRPMPPPDSPDPDSPDPDSPDPGRLDRGAPTERMGQPAQDQAAQDQAAQGQPAQGQPIAQGYPGQAGPWQVRVRLAGQTGWLTLKSTEAGASRRERECEIPAALAQAALDGLPETQKISKIRYKLPGPDGLVWEIDQFLGRHAGVWLAEIELPDAGWPLALPDWLGPEVTDAPAWRNAAMASAPAAPARLPAGLQPFLERLLALDAGF